MNTRYSSQELFVLRNYIPIHWLIQHILKLPVQTTDSVFRFQCPLCSQFDTATHLNTNLARCFSCQKNFNTIDLLITVRRLSFPHAVQLLRKFYARLALQQPQLKLHPLPITRNIPPNTPQPHSSQAAAQLTAIGEILANYKITKS